MHRGLIGLCLLFSSAMLAAEESPVDELPALSIDPARITVSGMSSGAQMAHQLHLAYSELFSGVALVAGGPFGCAEGSIVNALGRCLGKPGTDIPLEELQALAQAAAADGRLAPLDNLAGDRVWIFHGSLDQAVPEVVNSALVQFYQTLLPATRVEAITEIPASHVFPAKETGGSCETPETPFVGNCNYDAAGTLLQYLYPGLNQPDPDEKPEPVRATLAGAADALLDETAWLYVPPACAEPNAGCALHLVLHGCAQSTSQVQTAFIEQSGYLPWAEQNNIVLAFPQVVASPANPLACWDWWGYSDTNYLWRKGKQMRLLANWTRQLAGLEPF